MSEIELVVFGALWLMTFVLGALILLLYRQVEKAYRSQSSSQMGGLLPGVEAPDIEILTAEGEAALPFPNPDELHLLAFMTTGCDTCLKLLRVLADDTQVNVGVTTLMSGETRKDTVIPTNPRVEMLWLAHPPDAVHRYGASVAPFIYILRGRTILASKAVSSPAGLVELIGAATRNEAQLVADRSDFSRASVPA